MTGGPFRDTLTPLIEDAQRQLTQLRQERDALETRYQDALVRLDQKAQVPEPLVQPTPPSEDGFRFVLPARRTLRTLILIGLVLGLSTWLPIFLGHP
jgi:hypothetical protein